MHTTPFFKELGPLLFGRPKTKLGDKIRRLKGLEDLYEMFGNLLPDGIFDPTEGGAGSRQRKLPTAITFWAFLSQILHPRSSCRDAVHRIEAWWRYAQAYPAQGVSSEAYIQARQRLRPEMLELILRHTGWHLDRHIARDEEVLPGRNVLLVDGTGLSMPDTKENQQQWPQHSEQKPGCGFPLMTMVGVFSLANGGLQHYVTGNKHDQESVLFQRLYPRLNQGDVVIEDRGFCSYCSLAMLQAKGVDTLVKLHHQRNHDLRQGKPLGPGDRLISWSKPLRCPPSLSQQEFANLPATLCLRLIEIRVAVPGFRTRRMVLVTTLLDPGLYPAQTLRQLYRRRWEIEGHFAQIKTILQTDVLRCQSPDMIQKELLVHLIAYNLLRCLMQKSAHTHHVPLERISFKGTLDAFHHYADAIRAAANAPKKQAELVDQLLETMATDLLPVRPDRCEPRAIKRRPKQYYSLSHPRSEMRVPHDHADRKKKK